MARKKNASFVGVPLRDVARDASIYSRTIDNAAGDLQLLYDRVTGENAHTVGELITHKGSGNGSPINIPIGAQSINRNLRVAGAGSSGLDHYIITIPIFVPNNTQADYKLDVDVDTFDDEELFCESRSTSWALNFTDVGQVLRPERGDTTTVRFHLTLGSGWQYLAVRRRLFLDEEDTRAFLRGWRLYPWYFSEQTTNGLAIPGSAAAGNDYPSLSSLTPTVAADNTVDTAMTAPNSPLDPWVLTRLNRMAGALWEYLTGAPVPGNNTITLATTRDHNRSVFSAEPLVELPMVSVALSAFAVQCVTVKTNYLGTLSTSNPIQGPIDFVRYPQTTTSGGSPVVHIVSQNELWFPSFATGASSTLAARVLILDYSTGGIGGNWQARFVIGGVTSSWVTFAVIAGTNLYAASFSALNFTASAANQVRLEIQNTSGSASIAGQEIIVLGYSLAFTPP